MTQATYIVGDTRDVTATLEDDSVDLILTSPPFLALRSYLPTDHPEKHREIGSEPTPAAFLDVLLGLTADWGRVLAPHGSICVEIGDTYSGSGGSGGDYNVDGLRDGAPKFSGSAKAANRNRPRDTRPGRENTGYESPPRPESPGGHGWPLAKSLTMIPEMYRLALAYGINPLTGKESPAGRWRIRNVVRWHRPNPAPGALADKYRPATTDLVVACKSKTRWFDLGAVTPNDKGPPHDTWHIPTAPFAGAHYASWPPSLLTIPIDSMCPRYVCRQCGKPRRRIVGLWTDCEHDDYRKGVVLDPLAGTGTTLAVATGMGRDAIGIDNDSRNVGLVQAPVGMFLTVKHHEQETT